MGRRRYSGNAPRTTLAGGISADATSLTLTDGTGYPASDFFIKLGAGTATEEVVLVGTRSGNACSGVLRNQDGTVASAHDAGESVIHGGTATDLDEANAHVHAEVAAHLAEAIAFTPTGTLEATNVRDAILELLAEKASVNQVPGGVPTGAMFMWPTATAAPAGYLLADGQAVSRTTYAALFDQYGTTHGAGNGTTTFNLPDMRRRVPTGPLATDTGFDTIGEGGGASTITLTVDQIPGHVHKGPSHAHSTPEHSHNAGTLDVVAGGGHAHDSNGTDGKYVVPIGSSTLSVPNTTHADDFGSHQPVTMSVQDQAGHHDHTLGGATGETSGGNTGAAGTGDTSSTGGGEAHNNWPPYRVVHFIVKT